MYALVTHAKACHADSLSHCGTQQCENITLCVRKIVEDAESWYTAANGRLRLKVTSATRRERGLAGVEVRLHGGDRIGCSVLSK